MTPETRNSKIDGDPIVVTYAGDTHKPPSNAIANAARALGVLSVTIGFVIPIVFGVLAIVVGATALIRIRRNPHRYTGRRLARVGVMLGIFGLIVPSVVILSALNWVQGRHWQTICSANLGGIGQGIRMYAEEDPNGVFPDDIRKLTSAGMVTSKQLQCPAVSRGGPCYHYVPGYSLSSDPKCVVMFEGIDNHNGDGGWVLYQDGSVAFLTDAELQLVINENMHKAQ